MPGTASSSADVDPRARFDPSDTVDEHDDSGGAVPGAGRAGAHGLVDLDLDVGLVLGASSSLLEAGAVRRVPRIDGELHGSSRSTRAPRSVRGHAVADRDALRRVPVRG